MVVLALHLTRPPRHQRHRDLRRRHSRPQFLGPRSGVEEGTRKKWLHAFTTSRRVINLLFPLS
jgi:hypothetical protein